MSNKTNNFLIQGVAYTIIDSDARVAIQALADGLDTKNAIFQYSTMPTAASTNVGQIVQFIGTTTSDYINGYFYKCVADSQLGTYVWEAIPTQAAANIFQVSTVAELEAIEDGQIVQYVGTTTASYTNGHFYTATTESSVKTISEVEVQSQAQTPRLLATVTTLADLKTQFATAITGYETNHMASLTITADITLDNNCVLTSGTNVLFWYDNSAAQVIGVATSSEGVISIKTVVGAGIIISTINGYKTSGAAAPELLFAVDTLAELKENLSEVITRHRNGESTFVTFSISTAITLDNGEPIPSNTAVSAYFSNGVPGGVVAYCFTGQAVVKTLQIVSNGGVVTTVNGYQIYNDTVYNEKTSVINIDTLAELKESLYEIYDGSLGDAPKQYSVNTAFASSNSVTIPVNSQLYIFGHKYDDDGYTGIAITPSGVMYTIVTDYPDATNIVINLYKIKGHGTERTITASSGEIIQIDVKTTTGHYYSATYAMNATYNSSGSVNFNGFLYVYASSNATFARAFFFDTSDSNPLTLYTANSQSSSVAIKSHALVVDGDATVTLSLLSSSEDVDDLINFSIVSSLPSGINTTNFVRNVGYGDHGCAYYYNQHTGDASYTKQLSMPSRYVQVFVSVTIPGSYNYVLTPRIIEFVTYTSGVWREIGSSTFNTFSSPSFALSDGGTLTFSAHPGSSQLIYTITSSSTTARYFVTMYAYNNRAI